MITKGEIQSIDYQGNTCVVRLPYFESAGIKDNIQATATIGNQPGMYNGYKVGDVVYVAFEDGEANQPVVIGKLFLGSDKEQKDPRGVMNCESSIISNNIELPITTKIVYETDGTVAQNGNTRYDSISDITNELGKLTAKQDKTSYDVTGVITAADMLKSEISAVKAGSGSKNTYASETKPANFYNKLSDDEQVKLTETSDYVGYYIKNNGSYVLVTADNKDKLSIFPPYTLAYKFQALEQGDIWVYTGSDIFEKIGTKEKSVEYIGTYVYYKGDAITTDDPISTKCPDCSKDFYKAADGYSFKLIDASNYSSISGQIAYKKHLAKNASFTYSGTAWEEATISDVIEYGSAITQTATTISAKVNKTHLNGTDTEFGWQLHEKVDGAESITGTEKPGDADGQFTVYSKINYADTSKETQTKDVLHINKNGMWVNGNLEVEDSEEQKIFRALPYGDYVVNDDKITYDGNPKVDIGGFTVEKTTLKNSDIGFSVGSEGLNITNSDTDQFSVLSDGTIWGKKLYIEQDDKHNSGSASYFDGNVCGHQMKVDTVELATTNTDQGESQTEGFRVEEYEVKGSGDSGKVVVNDAGEYELFFGIKDAYDSRDLTTNPVEKKRTSMCVGCVLQNKQIGAQIKLTYYIDENKKHISTVSFTANAIIVGYPYSSNNDGPSITTAQQDYLWDNDMGAFKKLQSDNVVKIILKNNRICLVRRQIKSNEEDGKPYIYGDWPSPSPISALSNIECYGIRDVEVISWTPQKEEYFTGDFIASTGFFKDRNCYFTEGCLVDVFALPWKRNGYQETGGSLIGNLHEAINIPIQILEVTSDGNTYYYAYKELREGDYCEVNSGDIIPYSYRWAMPKGSSMLSCQKLTPSFVLTTPSENLETDPETEYTYDELIKYGSETIPALKHFTSLEAVNNSLIRKYLVSNATSLDTWEDNDLTPTSQSEKISWVNRSWDHVPFYSISTYYYGSNMQKKATDGETTTYESAGAKLCFCVDNVGFKKTDSGTEQDKIYVFSSRPLYCYANEDEGRSIFENTIYTFKYKIQPIASDALSILLYGGNSTVTTIKESNTYNTASTVNTQGSGSYLQSSNMATWKSPSDSSVIANNISFTDQDIRETLKSDTTTNTSKPSYNGNIHSIVSLYD